MKHWRLIEGDYSSAPCIEATWFIDPPYQNGAGSGYRFGTRHIDYGMLAGWVLERTGQVICCEGAGADWLPFHLLCHTIGVAGKVNKEVVYVSYDGIVDIACKRVEEAAAQPRLEFEEKPKIAPAALDFTEGCE